MQCCFPCHEGTPREQINSYSFLSLAGPIRFTRSKQRWYSLKMRLGTPISGLDVLVERKCHVTAGIRTPHRSDDSLVTI